MGSLTKAAVHGALWNGISRFGGQGLQFVTTIILASILTPDDFGTVAMASTFLLLAKIVNQFGISASIIQHKDITEEHLSSAFWVNICIGVVMCLMTILFSGAIGQFYQNDTVVKILRILAVTFIVGSAYTVHFGLLQRELKFKSIAGTIIISAILTSVISICLAYYGWGVWSIVWGRLVGDIAACVATMIISQWRPRFIFNLSKFKELFHFGINALGVSFLSYLILNLDNILIGKYLGTALLGVYGMAYNIISIPQKNISGIIASVAFPAFSKIQDDLQNVRVQYFRLINFITLLTFPILIGLMALAPDFIAILLNEKWRSIVIPLQILCVVGMVNSVGFTVGSVFFGLGRADLELRLDLVNLTCLALAIFIGVQWGIIGVAIAVGAEAMLLNILYFYNIAKLIETKLSKIYLSMLPNLVSGTLMGIAVYFFRITAGKYTDNILLLFTSSILVGATVYIILSIMINGRYLKEFITVTGLRKIIKSS